MVIFVTFIMPWAEAYIWLSRIAPLNRKLGTPLSRCHGLSAVMPYLLSRFFLGTLSRVATMLVRGLMALIVSSAAVRRDDGGSGPSFRR